MNLTRPVVYALHALGYLAGQPPGRLVPSRAVAGATGVPPALLHQVLLSLASAGVLRSLKGHRGGYLLARPAKGLTLLEVVEAVDTSSVPASFAGAKGGLDKRLAEVCQQATELVRQRLGKVRLADLVKG
jgi:Rrf2 family protein